MPHAVPVDTPKDQQHVLICGAGLGGLALAQGLKKAGISFTIFERDPSADFRPQGYRLKLNADGSGALRSVLPQKLWERFELTCCTTEAGETDFNAISGTILNSRSGAGLAKGPPPMTCDRTVLRNILFDGILGTDAVQFNKEITHFEEDALSNSVTASFSDGTTVVGTLLVGADGVRSRVRKQLLPTHKPLNTEGFCVYGKTRLTPELAGRFPRRALRWMTLCVDKTPITHSLDVDDRPLTLLLEPIRFRSDSPFKADLPPDYVYWVLISRTETFAQTEEEVQRLLKLSCDESATLSLEMTKEWDESIRSLLEMQDVKQSSTLRVSSADPDMAAWESNGRVTLLGDAIHVMSPCGGVGAATALKDASELTRVLDGGESSSIKEQIELYESAMRGRAKASIERSFFGGKKMFGQKPFAQCRAVDI